MSFYLDDRSSQFLDDLDPLMPRVTIAEEDELALVDFIANGLTDPRVANETFPFDRPTLSGVPEPTFALGVLVGVGFLVGARRRRR